MTKVKDTGKFITGVKSDSNLIVKTDKFSAKSSAATQKEAFEMGKAATRSSAPVSPVNLLIETIFTTGKEIKTLRTAMEKMEQVREGVDKSELELLKDRAGLDYDDLAEVLPATRATLLSKKGKEKFSAVVSEAIVSIADIYSYGYQVFEDDQRFNNWIKEPLQALDGATPFSLLDNQFGREEVRDLIGRIAYGVYS